MTSSKKLGMASAQLMASIILTLCLFDFFGTLKKMGNAEALIQIGEAAGLTAITSYTMLRFTRPAKLAVGKFGLCALSSFFAIELFTFFPRFAHLNVQEKMWLPVAMIFLPISLAPVVLMTSWVVVKACSRKVEAARSGRPT